MGYKNTLAHFQFDGIVDEALSTEFTWTPLGQLESVSYPECVTTETGTRHCDDGGGKDVVGPDLTVTQTYNHDYVRAVTTNLAGALPRIDVEYADNLQVRKVLYANGTESFYQKDPWGMPRPRKITHSKGSTKYFNRNIYRHDGAGNLWQAGTDTYTYDKAGRLLSGEFASAGSMLSEDYQYDAADNLVSVSTDGGPPQAQVYWGNTNRLSGAANDIEYDAAGNVIAIARLGTGGPRWQLTYDAFDMQTSYVENPEGQFMNFLSVYGPGDYRIATLDSLTGERTVTIRDMGSSVLREWSVQGFGSAADWVHRKDYLYGPTGMWASRAQDGEVHYFHRDHLGSTRTITDSSGNKIGRRDYYPYGRDARDGTGQYDQRMAKYTGHERDPHNLSDYMLARTYAYPLRRFLTPDPARDGWNQYGYVHGNPLNSVDPDGLVAETPWDALNVGVGATSFVANASMGNFVAAAVDLLGLTVDSMAAATPGVPAFAGTAIRASRAADKAADVARGAARVGARRRATQIHNAAGEVTQSRTTIAVTETLEGPRIISSSEPRLRRQQKAILRPGEIAASGSGHAEVTGVREAFRRGPVPTGVGASRPICPDCADYLELLGIPPLSPLK